MLTAFCISFCFLKKAERNIHQRRYRCVQRGESGSGSWVLGVECTLASFSLFFTRFVHLGAPARKALGMKACKLHRTDVRCAAVCCAVWRASLWWRLCETMEREDVPRRLPRGVVCADPVTLKSREDASHYLRLKVEYHLHLVSRGCMTSSVVMTDDFRHCPSPPGTESAQGSS